MTSSLIVFYDLFTLISGSAYALWEWLNSAIAPELVEIFSLPADTTYIELALYSGLIFSLVFCVIKFFKSVFPVA